MSDNRTIRLLGNASGKAQRLDVVGKYGPIMVKEIAYVGKFTTQDGDEIELTEGLLKSAVDGSRALMASGFNVRAFLDHEATSSKDVAGTWIALWLTGRKLFGLLQAHGGNMADKVEPLDTSLVLEEDIHVRDDLVVPFAITRIDVVPQGAVTGTGPFARLARERKQGMIAKALAKLAGLEEGASMEDIAAAIDAMDGQDIGAGEIVDRFRAALGADSADEEEPEVEGEEEPEVDGEEEPEVEGEKKPEPSAAMSRQLSQARAEIRDLQSDKLDAELALIESDSDRKTIRAQFSRLTKAGTPFAVAFDTVKTAAKLASKAGKRTRVAPRKGQPSRGGETDIEQARKSLFAAAERRGYKPKGASK